MWRMTKRLTTLAGETVKHSDARDVQGRARERRAWLSPVHDGARAFTLRRGGDRGKYRVSPYARGRGLLTACQPVRPDSVTCRRFDAQSEKTSHPAKSFPVRVVDIPHVVCIPLISAGAASAASVLCRGLLSRLTRRWARSKANTVPLAVVLGRSLLERTASN